MMHAGALAAAPLAATGSLPDQPARLAVPDDPAAFLAAVMEAAQARMSAFLAGLQRYQQHAYRRDMPAVPELWRDGATRLLDYRDGRRRGRPLLVVPSLINRYTVLDLMAGRSLLRWLAGQGFRPFVVDWGDPGEAERELDVAGHVTRLSAALDAVRATSRMKPVLVGYCMGGTLAVALAQRRQADLAGLALLAAPWDFHADGRADEYATLAKTTAPVLAACGELPVDLLQALFASLDPLLGWRKFRRFAALPEGSEPEREFVAIEDWLNDGAALPRAVAWDCLFGWYAENRPGRGTWRIDGETIDPAAIDVPAFVAIPRADRIVPPPSAAALAERLPRAQMHRPPSGHIGMVVSARAERGLWQPLADWLAAIPGTRDRPARSARRSARTRSPRSGSP